MAINVRYVYPTFGIESEADDANNFWTRYLGTFFEKFWDNLGLDE